MSDGAQSLDFEMFAELCGRMGKPERKEAVEKRRKVARR
jgi:hypothetical protein